jgi:hypothetical protein
LKAHSPNAWRRTWFGELPESPTERTEVLAPVRIFVMLRERNMDIRSGQKRAWATKVVKGFSTTDVPLKSCLLQGGIAEAFDV